MSEKYLCVFCGSSMGNPPDKYQRMAEDFVDACAEHHINIVTGGGTHGLMGAVAHRALERDLKVIGIIPRHLMEWERKSNVKNGLTELIVTDSMADRKIEMVKRSHGFVALPGGIGTLDELYEVITGAYFGQLGIHYPGSHTWPIGIFSLQGFYAHQLRSLKHISRQGFIRNDQGMLAQLIVEQHARPLMNRMAPAMQHAIAHNQKPHL